MNPNPLPKMTPEEFLVWERAEKFRHEYRDGEIVAMSGASRAHNLISVNMTRELSTSLRDRDCETYASEMRLWIPKTRLYTYPDIVVVCGEPQFIDNQFDTLLNPVVVVEILSDSTESYDRGRKFEQYRRVETLNEYILISQPRPYVERFVKRGDGFWQLSESSGFDAVLVVESLGLSIPLASIYEKVRFTDE
jgi:Uma2 family endonuclease